MIAYMLALARYGALDISRPLGYNVAQEEVNAMTDNSVVRARIDERTKREAAAALKKIGLTVSDAFRLLLVRVAAEKALPFEPLNPNAETVAAMKAARRGELVKRRQAGQTAAEPECGKLNTPPAFSATTGEKNPVGTARSWTHC